MMRCNFTFVFVPGKGLQVADALSQAPVCIEYLTEEMKLTHSEI